MMEKFWEGIVYTVASSGKPFQIISEKGKERIILIPEDSTSYYCWVYDKEKPSITLEKI